MEKSSFFKSVAGDRKYKVEDFAAFFNSLITNGVFPKPSTNLQIIANNNMTVTIKAGKAWINGYCYINDSDLILPIATADGVFNRIDRIVVQFNTINRNITAKVKKGVFASSPIATVLQRDADAFELGVADIYIGKGITSISQSNITDLRMNTSLCGWVNSLIQADTTAIFNQYSDWFTTKTGQYNNEMVAKEIDFTNQFNTWFTTVQGQLSGDIAGNLTNQINSLAGAGRTTETVKGNATAIANLSTSVATSLVDIVQDVGNIDDATLDATLKGKSLTEMAKVLFTNANDGKTAVANAITAKGVAASPTDTFPILASKIGNLAWLDIQNITYAGQTMNIVFAKPMPDTNYNVEIGLKDIFGMKLGIEIYTISNKTVSGFTITNNIQYPVSYPMFRKAPGTFNAYLDGFYRLTYDVVNGRVLALDTHYMNGTQYRIFNVDASAYRNISFTESFSYMYGDTYAFRCMLYADAIYTVGRKASTGATNFLNPGNGALMYTWPTDSDLVNDFRACYSLSAVHLFFFGSNKIQKRTLANVITGTFNVATTINAENVSYSASFSMDAAGNYYFLAKSTTHKCYLVTYNSVGVLVSTIMVHSNYSSFISNSNLFYMPNLSCIVQFECPNFDNVMYAYFPVFPNTKVISYR